MSLLPVVVITHWRSSEESEMEPLYRRDDVLEHVAQEFDKMKSLGDTAASFAAYVRNMKIPK